MPCGCNKRSGNTNAVMASGAINQSGQHTLTLPAGHTFPDGTSSKTYLTKGEADGVNAAFGGVGTVTKANG